MRLFLVLCCVLCFCPAQAQDIPDGSVNSQKVQALYADVQAKQTDLLWQWEMAQERIQQKRLAISRLFARAYTLKWISSLQKRYGGDKASQQKAYLWLMLKRSLLNETANLIEETSAMKRLESEKNRLDEAARSFDFYTPLQVP